MNQPKTTARREAFQSLLRMERGKRYSNLEIDSSLKKNHLEGAEKGLYTALVYGVTERKISLDYLIGRLSSRPIITLDLEVLILLRIGLYQMIWLDRIPDSAAVNESVELAKAFAPKSASFVNALLRNFLRTVDRKALPWPEKNDPDYLSVRYSCGKDVVRLLSGSLTDPEATLSALEGQPPVTMRANTLKISREALLEKLSEAGIAAEPTRYSPDGIRLREKTIPGRVSEWLNDGILFIQDEASQLAVRAADPKPGDHLIDACACPGGKSFSAAILMQNRGEVKSFDLHKNKLSLVDAGAEKLGITILQTEEKNGAVFDASLEETADVVLCDAPCSGLGVIAKKPEIRYKELSETERLPSIQYAILSNVSRYVKVGGILCYSTCTLNQAENEGVSDLFLEEHPDFSPTDFSFGELSSENGHLTLLPDKHGTDGFYIAKFRRNQKKDTI